MKGGLEAQLLEVHGGQVHHARATRLAGAIDALPVTGRLIAQTALGLGHQGRALAEERGACRADRRAGGRLAVPDRLLVAHDALAYAGHGLAPLVARNAEGTGGHAVAAADAFGLVVHDRALVRLVQGPHRAHRCAGWFLAVHALSPDVNTGLVFDGGPGGGRQTFAAIVERQAVGLLARQGAAAATDALGGVDEHSELHRRVPSLADRPGSV